MRRRRKPNVNAGRNQPIVESQTQELEEDSDPKKKQKSTRQASGHTQDDWMNVESQKESMVRVFSRTKKQNSG